jgi:hypothetical protein
LSKLLVFICGNRGFSKSICALGHSPGAVNQAVTIDGPLTKPSNGTRDNSINHRHNDATTGHRQRDGPTSRI